MLEVITYIIIWFLGMAFFWGFWDVMNSPHMWPFVFTLFWPVGFPMWCFYKFGEVFR